MSSETIPERWTFQSQDSLMLNFPLFVFIKISDFSVIRIFLKLMRIEETTWAMGEADKANLGEMLKFNLGILEFKMGVFEYTPSGKCLETYIPWLLTKYLPRASIRILIPWIKAQPLRPNFSNDRESFQSHFAQPFIDFFVKVNQSSYSPAELKHLWWANNQGGLNRFRGNVSVNEWKYFSRMNDFWNFK